MEMITGFEDTRDLTTSSDHKDHERMYAKLLDVVGDELNEEEEIITDPATLDLFLVFGKPFALHRSFLRVGALAILQGVIMGFVGLGFFNGFDKVSKSWLGAEDDEWYDKRLHDNGLTYNSGKWWWVAITTAGGLVVGLIKLIPALHFPARPKGLFSEVKDLHVDPQEAPGICLVSCISLACGASVGPEMALGSLGGGLGTWLSHKLGTPQEETFKNILLGMAAAMGPLLPSPILSVILLHELSVMAGRTPEHFMESVVSAGIASTVSWFIFSKLANKTFLDVGHIPISLYDAINIQGGYKHVWLGESVIFGIIGGFIGLVTLMLMGVCRNIDSNMRRRLGARRATVVMPTLAGLLVGLIGVAFPLTFGDGSLQLTSLIASGSRSAAQYSVKYLIGTMFMKMIALSISLGFGFIGGQIFPCIFIGTCAGVAASQITNVPVLVTVPCFMVAVPGAFCPIPFTLVGIASLSLVLGSDITTLSFTSVFVAFISACGTGILQRLVRRGGERQAKIEAAFKKEEEEKEQAVKKRLRQLENENKLLRKISTNMQGLRPEDLADILHGSGADYDDDDDDEYGAPTDPALRATWSNPPRPSPYLS